MSSTVRAGFSLLSIFPGLIFAVVRHPGFVEHVLPGEELGLPSDFLDIALIQFEPEP